MQNTEKATIAPNTMRYLEDSLAFSPKISADHKDGNSKTVNSAVIYEKFRVALEYQEEHLVFKNAVSRIVRRKYTLNPNIQPEQLRSDLVSELSWANYINPETLTEEETTKLDGVLSRYLLLLSNLKSKRGLKHELDKMAVNWLACEIDEILKPHPDPNVLVNYVYSTIEKNIKTGDARISAADNETQCKLAIFILVFKPDTPLLQFWAIRRAYPEWSSWSVDEVKRFARSFDPYYNKVDKILLNPLRKRYLQFAKRYIAPFILLNKLVNSNKINLHTVQEKPALLKNLLVELYDQEVVEARQKVWRGTTRALLFVFLTKISLAFILEVPVDRFLTGEINYLSLGINVYLPPLLMLVAGTFVKAPPAQNRMVVADAVSNILYHDKINNSTFVIKKKKTGSGLEDFFDVFYLLFSGLVLVGVVRLLLYLHFNFLSIILFFFFVSVVSFFSFRIRTMALELAMRRAGDGGLTSWVEFFFLPFIQTGKLISEKFAQSNPFILALDFLIEAPFKSIMKILGLWFKFINAKKEEIEL